MFYIVYLASDDPFHYKRYPRNIYYSTNILRRWTCRRSEICSIPLRTWWGYHRWSLCRGGSSIVYLSSGSSGHSTFRSLGGYKPSKLRFYTIIKFLYSKVVGVAWRHWPWQVMEWQHCHIAASCRLWRFSDISWWRWSYAGRWFRQTFQYNPSHTGVRTSLTYELFCHQQALCDNRSSMIHCVHMSDVSYHTYKDCYPGIRAEYRNCPVRPEWTGNLQWFLYIFHNYWFDIVGHRQRTRMG